MNAKGVLIVQPHTGLARSQRKQIEEAGHQVVCVTSSAEAIESVSRGEFALMVLEYILPGEIDGLETYAHLKADGYDLPVILVTDSTDETVLLKALRAGVVDFFRRTPGYLNLLAASISRRIGQVRVPVQNVATQSRLHGIIESAKDAIIAVNQDQRITLFNPAAEKMFCCTAKEALAQPITRFLPREFSSEQAGHDAAGEPSSNTTVSLSTSIPFQTRGRRNTGEEFPLEATLSRFEIDKRKFYTLMVRDISERVRAEQALQQALQQTAKHAEQLKAMTAHLQRVREEERTRIAREIHDELGQTLTGLKMDVSWLGKKLSADEPPPLQEKIKQMASMIDTMILTVKRIGTELRPAVLDSLGLMAALEWLTQDFEKRLGVPCAFLSDREDIVIDAERATALFRICQEALTNVIRHAEANNVVVRVRNEDSVLILEVEDDGKGLPVDEAKQGTSFGLLGMRERTMLLNGQFEVNRRPTGGTVVRAAIPLI